MASGVSRVDILLNEAEKERFAQCDELVEDRSLSTKLLSPFWEFLVRLIPLSIAPNLISLAGLLCTIQAFYLCFSYMATHPRLVTVGSAALIFAYQTLDALDGLQARRTSNTSPVGALFDHACDNVAVVFVSLVGCYVVGVTNSITQWYVVQIFALGLLLVHLGSLPVGRLSFGSLTGPGEAVFVFLSVLLSYAFFGASRVEDWWTSAVTLPIAKQLLQPSSVYYAMVVLVLVRAWRLPAQYRETRLGVLFCMLFRIGPAVLYYLGWVRSESLLNVICDGLIVSVISTDLAVSRMAKRQLHPWVWLFAMASVINYLAIVGVVVLYYFLLFYELTTSMKLPMFTLARNVYVDGVYDLCHVGHHNVFLAALQHGNRLFVGVLSDESVAAYKRKPVMTMEERAEVVATCKGVYKVIKNAPCPGIPEEFLKKHNIHVVCLSTEYDKPDDIYYAVPRKLGITRVLPRTEGMSTSDLIKRVKMYGTESKQVF